MKLVFDCLTAWQVLVCRCNSVVGRLVMVLRVCVCVLPLRLSVSKSVSVCQIWVRVVVCIMCCVCTVVCCVNAEGHARAWDLGRPSCLLSTTKCGECCDGLEVMVIVGL